MPQLDLARIQALVKDGKTYTQIAQELGCTKSGVSSAIRRVRNRTAVLQFARKASDANLSDAAGLFLSCMSTDVQSTMSRVRSRIPPRSDEKELVRESVLEKLNRRAMATYGLDREVSQSVKVGLSINITKPPLDSEAAIEVQSTVSNECGSSSTPEVQSSKDGSE